MPERDSAVLLADYPKIYLACHSRHVRDPASDRRVSTRQVQILDHLDTESSTALGELARHLGVTASTMSLAVDRLERDGFVQRRRDAGDGRRVALFLTEAGARVRDAHSVLDPGRVRRVLSRLSPEDRARALAGLQLLAEAAAAELAGVAAPPFSLSS